MIVTINNMPKIFFIILCFIFVYYINVRVIVFRTYYYVYFNVVNLLVFKQKPFVSLHKMYVQNDLLEKCVLNVGDQC